MRWREAVAPTAANRAFWEGLRNGSILASACTSCGRWSFYGRPVCPDCGALHPPLRPLAGGGTVYSVTVVRRSPFEDLQDAPYAVALVDMDEGVRIMGRVEGVDAEAVAIGQRVSVRIVPCDDAASWWVFVPERAAVQP